MSAAIVNLSIAIYVIFASWLAFQAGRSVFGNLARSIRAKKALEAEVLRRAQGDDMARASITNAAADLAQMGSAVIVVNEAAAALDDGVGNPARRALELGRFEGNTDYAQDIVRLVKAKLVHAE